jgi:hypothetical protein
MENDFFTRQKKLNFESEIKREKLNIDKIDEDLSDNMLVTFNNIFSFHFPHLRKLTLIDVILN